MDTIIVDGYNLLCDAGGSKPATSEELARARSDLVARLEQHQHVTGDAVIVVFDGPPLTPHSRGAHGVGSLDAPADQVRVIYSRGGDADAAIESLVRQVAPSTSHPKASSARGSVFVVTEDRALLTRVSRLGARPMGHGRFAGLVERARSAWSGQDAPPGAAQSLFDRLDRHSLNRLKELRLKLKP